MRSMTGYGQGSAAEGSLQLTVEISSVNRRNLDLALNLPGEWQVLERDVTAELRSVLERGKIYLRCRIESTREITLDWDDEAVHGVLERLRGLADRQGVDFHPDAGFLLRLVSTLSSGATRGVEADSGKPLLMQALAKALEGLLAMREAEGMRLRDDFHARLQNMAAAIARIRGQAGDAAANYRELLLQRLRKSGLELDFEDERVLREVALFADRCDISEELTRLDSHLAQFQASLAEQGAIGRKLDFICQEIHREINTIASKSTQLAVIQETLECRNELERIREQVQNVE